MKKHAGSFIGSIPIFIGLIIVAAVVGIKLYCVINANTLTVYPDCVVTQDADQNS